MSAVTKNVRPVALKDLFRFGRDETFAQLYFQSENEEFSPRTMSSLSNAFTCALKELDPIPEFQG
jgi:hypothetical protein